MSAAIALVESRAGAAEFIAGAARRYWANDNSAVKRVARVVKRGERTAENYWNGKVTPGVPEFLLLAMEIPELRAAVAQLLKLDVNHDPAALKLLDEIRRYAETRRGE